MSDVARVSLCVSQCVTERTLCGVAHLDHCDATIAVEPGAFPGVRDVLLQLVSDGVCHAVLRLSRSQRFYTMVSFIQLKNLRHSYTRFDPRYGDGVSLVSRGSV